MPDTTVTVTTKGTHTWASIATGVVALLLIFAGGLAPTFTQLASTYPNVIWLQLVATATGGGMLAAVTASLNKNALLQAQPLYSALVQAAQAAAPAVGSVVLSHFVRPTAPTVARASEDTIPTPSDRPAVKP